MKHQKIAAYLDYLNVYKAYEGTDKFQDVLEYIEEFIRSLMLKTSVVSKQVYCPQWIKNTDCNIQWLKKRGWKIFQGAWRKDIDTRMVADIVEDCVGSVYTAFVIISGDTDFEPALQKIKRMHRASYVFACENTYRKILQKACTNFQVITIQ